MMRLFVTYCSGNKRKGAHSPKALYVSDRITRFIKHCEDNSLNWAILSALHALVFPDEQKHNYNVTFISESPLLEHDAVYIRLQVEKAIMKRTGKEEADYRDLSEIL